MSQQAGLTDPVTDIEYKTYTKSSAFNSVREYQLKIQGALSMKVSTSLFVAMTIIAISAAGSALAGPAVTVTFKNLGNTAADYTVLTSNEAITHANAKPKPVVSVRSGDTNTYIVQSDISPDGNFANLRYTMGGKTCTFLATFVAMPGPLRSKIPKWNNKATADGGATCTARSTSMNARTYAWSVEFTMR